MKLLSSLIVLLATTSAFAHTGSKTCSRGELGQDNRMEVVIKPVKDDFVVFNLHESSFSVSVYDVVTGGDSLAILNKVIRGSSEGTDLTPTANALLVYNEATNTMNTTLILDGSVLANAVDLKCD